MILGRGTLIEWREWEKNIYYKKKEKYEGFGKSREGEWDKFKEKKRVLKKWKRDKEKENGIKLKRKREVERKIDRERKRGII